MQKIKKLLISSVITLAVFLILIVPAISFSAGLVPCNNNTTPVTINGKVIPPTLCDWNALMALINGVIHFILFYMAIPVAAIMFAYAGFELVTSGGSTEKRGIARKVFTNAVIGLIIAVAAWLIINTILSILGYSGDWIGFVKPAA